VCTVWHWSTAQLTVGLLLEFMKGRKFADDEELVCMAYCWLEDEINNRSRALEKHWSKWISVATDNVEK